MLLFLKLNSNSYLLKNDHGTNQRPQVLDGNQLEYMFKPAEENLKMPVWKYNEKCFLKANDEQVIGYAVDKLKTDGDTEVINFTKICLTY